MEAGIKNPLVAAVAVFVVAVFSADCDGMQEHVVQQEAFFAHFA